MFVFGGGAAEKILGTQSNVFMTRATEVAAVMFVVTSLTLGIMSSQRGKSLLEKGQLLDIVKKSAPVIPTSTAKPSEVTKEVQKAAPVEEAAPAEGNAS